MSEAPYDLVRRAPCGCLHDPQGKPLVVCVTHVTDVEGQRGIRVRLSDGSLTFFAMSDSMAAAAEASWQEPPPAESLCGEEEALAAGLHEEVLAEVPEGSDDALRSWAAHCRVVGRSRTRAYAEALSLAQAQFEAWRGVFPAVADAAFATQGRDPLTNREKEVLAYYSAGFAAFLRDTLAVAEKGGRA